MKLKQLVNDANVGNQAVSFAAEMFFWENWV